MLRPAGRLVGRDLDEAEVALAALVEDLATRLRERRMFVRAFAFAQHMPFDPYMRDSSQWAGLEQLIRHSRDAVARTLLAQAIAKRATAILKALKRPELQQYADAMEYFVWLDAPETSGRVGDTARALLLTEDSRVLRYKEETAEARGWAEAYLLARDLGFVFAPPELAEFVFVAAELEVRSAFGVRIPSSMIFYAKQSEQRVEDLKRQLHDGRIFRG